MELKRLEFHAIQDKGIFYRWISDKVEWFYSTSKYLFKPTIRIQKRGSLTKGKSFVYGLWVFLNTNVVSFLEKEEKVCMHFSTSSYGIFPLLTQSVTLYFQRTSSPMPFPNALDSHLKKEYSMRFTSFISRSSWSRSP